MKHTLIYFTDENNLKVVFHVLGPSWRLNLPFADWIREERITANEAQKLVKSEIKRLNAKPLSV